MDVSTMLMLTMTTTTTKKKTPPYQYVRKNFEVHFELGLRLLLGNVLLSLQELLPVAFASGQNLLLLYLALRCLFSPLHALQIFLPLAHPLLAMCLWRTHAGTKQTSFEPTTDCANTKPAAAADRSRTPSQAEYVVHKSPSLAVVGV